jgi:translation initiation factor IF-1
LAVTFFKLQRRKITNIPLRRPEVDGYRLNSSGTREGKMASRAKARLLKSVILSEVEGPPIIRSENSRPSMSTPNPDEIRAQGRVIELMRDGACRVELPNGHRAVGQSRTYVPVLGDTVTIGFHPYDLARGWIVEPL